MKARFIAITLSLAIIALCAEAFGQGAGRGRGSGWGRNSGYQRHYDTTTVETVEGDVAKIEYISSRQSMRQGVHLRLREEEDELLSVHLGPKWFLDNQDVEIAEGDHVTVTGSRITLNGKPVIIAAEIVKDDEILRLRDEQGFPAWAGWRSRNR